ncbi:MAG TPA: hypothetical protein VKF37_16605, partial [Chloroflexota bacterium]|nr:hypothetical protein [Chloroflexota bacterium]
LSRSSPDPAVMRAQQPWRGAMDGDWGEEGGPCCRLRTLRATICVSRAGRKDDGQGATVTSTQG